MKAIEINTIIIKRYLSDVGIHLAKDKGYYGMYHSPFREDNDASLKVDYNKNLWIDFGSNEGGTLIDLMMRIEDCSNVETMRILEQKLSEADSFSFQWNNNSERGRERGSAIQITNVMTLNAPALLDFLSKRGISAELAKQYCKEVHYSITGKNYFAIGFPNDAGGWELRNKYFKGSISPKNTTTYNNGSDTVMVFEGFMDFLSYLSLKDNPSPMIDTAVLNSTANLPKAMPFLQSHKTVHAFLDNDKAGRKSLAGLRELLSGSEIVDQSAFYRNHKDLNEYWQEKSKSRNLAVETKAAVEIKRQISMKKRGYNL